VALHRRPFSRATAGYYADSRPSDRPHMGGRVPDPTVDRAGPAKCPRREIGIRAGSFRSRPPIDFATREPTQRRCQVGPGKGRQQRTPGFRTRLARAARHCIKPWKVRGAEGYASPATSADKSLRAVRRQIARRRFMGSLAPVGCDQSRRQHVYHLVWHRDCVATQQRCSMGRSARPCARSATSIRQSQDALVSETVSQRNAAMRHRPSSIQVALPILLRGASESRTAWITIPFPVMSPGRGAVIIREATITQLDRWGADPAAFLIHARTCSAALIVSAEFAHEAGEHVAASQPRAVDDYWNDRVETVTPPPRECTCAGRRPDHRPTKARSRQSFRELVRYGLRRRRMSESSAASERRHFRLKVQACPRVKAGGGYVGDRYGRARRWNTWNGAAAGGRGPGSDGERARHYSRCDCPQLELVRTIEVSPGRD